MIRIIMFVIFLTALAVYLHCPTCNKKTVVIETRDVSSKPSCSSCSGSPQKNKFKMIGDIKVPESKYTIEDFHVNQGKGMTSPGTSPTFGLWTGFNDVPVRACGKTAMPAVRNLPCNLPGKSLYNGYL